MSRKKSFFFFPFWSEFGPKLARLLPKRQTLFPIAQPSLKGEMFIFDPLGKGRVWEVWSDNKRKRLGRNGLRENKFGPLRASAGVI